MKRRIAVVGDELSRSGHVLPYDQSHGFTFHGHMTALIGGEAYCESCKSIGFIAKAGGPYRIKYGTTREAALDGDIVLCACATPPRIVASLAGESWCEDRDEGHSRGANPSVAQSASAGSAPKRYDEQFMLRDAKGSPLADTYYTIALQGTLVRGVTDSSGRTERYKTDGAQSVRIYLGHKQEV